MHVRRLQCGVAVGEFEVVGVTSNDNWYHTLDGFPFLSKDTLMDVPHDYILVTSERHLAEIREEYVHMGGDAERMLPIGVLDVANLTFSQVAELHRSRVSIIANNCWGGVTYHMLHMKFFPHSSTCLNWIEIISHCSAISIIAFVSRLNTSGQLRMMTCSFVIPSFLSEAHVCT